MFCAKNDLNQVNTHQHFLAQNVSFFYRTKIALLRICSETASPLALQFRKLN